MNAVSPCTCLYCRAGRPEDCEVYRGVTAPHADYPHLPGSLYDCLACEEGPCTCSGIIGCVSMHCTFLRQG